MELRELLTSAGPVPAIDAPSSGLSVAIASIVHDSREVGPGDVFCALRGLAFDGHRYIRDAARAGAAAVLVESGRAVPTEVASRCVVLRAPDTRVALAHLAAARAGHPSRDIDIVGVTGTNGKTTTVHLLAAIASAAGRPVRTIGTLTGSRTTPEATDIQPQLAAWRDSGVTLVAMEVSSHALAMHRVDGTRFSAVGFTNLTEDHLDFHPSMEDYFAAKARLFTAEFADRGVVVADRAHGRLLMDTAEIELAGIHPDAALVAQSDLRRLSFDWRGQRVDLPFGGRFNIANAMLAAELALLVGFDAAEIVTGLAAAEPVPGRFEPVIAEQQFDVIVDYAHTPDGLRRVLESVRADAGAGRVITVFGCGGDRDQAKRPRMGAAAEAYADLVVVTSDNPRSEDPGAIIADVVKGMVGEPEVVPDRREAIARAFALADPDDVVVIAGKGHEAEQIIGDRRLPFDDRVVARELLGART